MKHIELKAKLQPISGNAVFFCSLVFITQRAISAYDLSNCYIPSKQCFETMRFFKETHFPYKAATSTKKVVVICKLVVAFEIVKCFLSGRNLFVKVGLCLFKTYVLFTMCSVFHSNIPSGRCVFFKDWIVTVT